MDIYKNFKLSLYLCLYGLFLSSIIQCSHSATSPSDDKEVANLHLKIGSSHLAKGQYPQALRSLLTAESFDPKNATIKNNLGLAYYVRGKLSIARTKLTEAVTLDPKFSQARNNLARVLIDLEEYDKAITQLDIVNKDLLYLEPQRGWANLGIAYFHQKKYSKAQRSLLKSIALKREQCISYVVLGRVHFERKSFAQAASSLDQAVYKCKNKNYEEANYYGALSHFKLGHKSTAIAKMKENIKYFPNGLFTKKVKRFLELVQMNE